MKSYLPAIVNALFAFLMDTTFIARVTVWFIDTQSNESRHEMISAILRPDRLII